MKILAIDTTAITAAAALTEDDMPIGTAQHNGTLTHSETMLTMIDQILTRARLTPEEIDMLAVSAGPGSFTGVRIGVSLIKGLSFGRNIPCVPVSTLRALAQNLYPAAQMGDVPFYACPVMDARRNQLYTALFRYDRDAGGKVVCQRMTADDMITAAELAQRLSALDLPVWFVGEGCRVTEREISLPHCKEVPPSIRYQCGYSVAMAAKEIYDSAEDKTGFSDKVLVPTYLRPSQAERERSQPEK